MSDPSELLERFEREAQNVDEKKRATDSANAHANGVSCGIRWARDELEEALDETEERRPNAQTYEVTD